MLSRCHQMMQFNFSQFFFFYRSGRHEVDTIKRVRESWWDVLASSTLNYVICHNFLAPKIIFSNTLSPHINRVRRDSIAYDNCKRFHSHSYNVKRSILMAASCIMPHTRAIPISNIRKRIGHSCNFLLNLIYFAPGSNP